MTGDKVQFNTPDDDDTAADTKPNTKPAKPAGTPKSAQSDDKWEPFTW